MTPAELTHTWACERCKRPVMLLVRDRGGVLLLRVLEISRQSFSRTRRETDPTRHGPQVKWRGLAREGSPRQPYHKH